MLNLFFAIVNCNKFTSKVLKNVRVISAKSWYCWNEIVPRLNEIVWLCNISTHLVRYMTEKITDNGLLPGCIPLRE